MTDPRDVDVQGPIEGRGTDILSPDALAFVAALQREFNVRREELLAERAGRQEAFDGGELPGFLSTTSEVRASDWSVAGVPDDIADRRVEITGPTDRKMMINALNSGAKVFMADFEDANSPTWDNMVAGHVNLIDALERSIDFENPDGKEYRLTDDVAVLFVRPRGWHLVEKHVLVDGAPVSASLFDFGLYLFHNHGRLRAMGSGPYFYLPKLENHLEARLWNDVFNFAQDSLGVERGTIKATVLIETILAAFEMDEILYELKDHSAGLNAGRWDYIFSIIKKFRTRSDAILPDRNSVSMTVPFMRAYTDLLVKTCHRRGAHAMGGMAAFVPSRKNPDINATALAKVTEDKERESNAGFDGTWVAHPDLVPVAMQPFDGVLRDQRNQVSRQRDDVEVAAEDLLDFRVPDGAITEEGLRNNANVAIQYLSSWLTGNGAAAIFNLMEDAATAEIARSQIWQWVHNAAELDDGRTIDEALVRELEAEELDRIRAAVGEETFAKSRAPEAQALFEQVTLSRDFIEFLTLPAYDYLD